MGDAGARRAVCGKSFSIENSRRWRSSTTTRRRPRAPPTSAPRRRVDGYRARARAGLPRPPLGRRAGGPSPRTRRSCDMLWGASYCPWQYSFQQRTGPNTTSPKIRSDEQGDAYDKTISVMGRTCTDRRLRTRYLHVPARSCGCGARPARRAEQAGLRAQRCSPPRSSPLSRRWCATSNRAVRAAPPP